jgi:hypothetical protein
LEKFALTKLYNVTCPEGDPESARFLQKLTALSWIDPVKHKDIPREIVDHQQETIKKAMSQLEEMVRF